MSDRETPKQLPPDVFKDFSRFPLTQPQVRHQVYRAHAADRKPGYYSSSGEGRFDLTAPRGTLYVADTVRTAVRERLSGLFDEGNRIALSAVSNMVVSDLRLITPPCADLGADRLEDFGVTRELDTMVPYEIPQKWAQRFAAEGLGGIHYGARSTRGPMNCWAVFGPAGEHPVHESGERLDYVTSCILAGLAILGKPSSMAGAATATPPNR